jgi:hypothetical protein
MQYAQQDSWSYIRYQRDNGSTFAYVYNTACAQLLDNIATESKGYVSANGLIFLFFSDFLPPACQLLLSACPTCRWPIGATQLTAYMSRCCVQKSLSARWQAAAAALHIISVFYYNLYCLLPKLIFQTIQDLYPRAGCGTSWRRHTAYIGAAAIMMESIDIDKNLYLPRKTHP